MLSQESIDYLKKRMKTCHFDTLYDAAEAGKILASFSAGIELDQDDMDFLTEKFSTTWPTADDKVHQQTFSEAQDSLATSISLKANKVIV